jgi:hypothetical protein
MIRRCILFLSIGLAGCNSLQSGKDAANQEYAADSFQQSLEAYNICVKENPNDQQKCGALARVLEADKKRYEKN